jgi:hypothetical protein
MSGYERGVQTSGVQPRAVLKSRVPPKATLRRPGGPGAPRLHSITWRTASSLFSRQSAALSIRLRRPSFVHPHRGRASSRAHRVELGERQSGLPIRSGPHRDAEVLGRDPARPRGPWIVPPRSVRKAATPMRSSRPMTG